MSCLVFWRTADRLREFQIGTTDTSPKEESPTLNSYDVCVINNVSVGSGVFKLFDCSATARYVIIQQRIPEFLTLCEVKVFGGT